MIATLSSKVFNGSKFYIVTVAGKEVWNSVKESSSASIARELNDGTWPCFLTLGDGRKVYKVYHGTGVRPDYFLAKKPTKVVAISQEWRSEEVLSHLEFCL